MSAPPISMPPERARLGIIGWGRIGRRIATRLRDRPGAPRLVAVLVRPGQEAPDAPACSSLAAFMQAAPDVVVECASAAALLACGPRLLAAGIDVMPLSLSAFAEPENEALLTQAASAGPGRLEIPAGAMGSIGFLAAAREEGLRHVLFRAANGPVAWGRTAARDMLDLEAVSAPTVFLRAPVRAVARLFPRSLNVSVGVALAGLGLDATQAELTVDPALSQARFEVEASAGPGLAVMRVHGPGRPPGADPVDYTTFSVLRLLLRREARIMI